MGNIIEGQLDTTDLKYLPAEHPEFPALLLHPGDILFNRTNSAELVGKTAVYTGTPNPCTFASYLIRVRLKPPCLPPYLAFYLNSMFGRQWVASVVNQQVGQANVNGSKLRALRLPLPPLAEQSHIVGEIERHFSRIDAGVAALKRIQANLRRQRAAILKAACEGQSGGQALRGGWVEARLADVAEVQLGQQRAPVHSAAEIKRPYIRAANITWKGLDLSDVKEMGFPNEERYRLRHGDVLLAEASGSPGEVGKPAIWRDEIETCFYQKTLLRVRPRADAITPEYLYFSFLRDALCGRFAKMAPGVGILHLTAERMKEWSIVFPLPAEQRRIVRELERQLSVIDDAEKAVAANLARADRLRQAVLRQAFEGKLVPQDPGSD